jgi:hypothetical protein
MLPLLSKERVGVRFEKTFYRSEILPDKNYSYLLPTGINK